MLGVATLLIRPNFWRKFRADTSSRAQGSESLIDKIKIPKAFCAWGMRRYCVWEWFFKKNIPIYGATVFFSLFYSLFSGCKLGRPEFIPHRGAYRDALTGCVGWYHLLSKSKKQADDQSSQHGGRGLLDL
jgi:hypothetical protein